MFRPWIRSENFNDLEPPLRERRYHAFLGLAKTIAGLASSGAGCRRDRGTYRGTPQEREFYVRLGLPRIIGQNEEIFAPWSGVIFRSVSPRYARPGDILSGQGAYQAGGRWNAPGIYAIYGSLEPGLAADESFNFLLQHFGWQSRDVPPRMLVGVRASLRAVLDLTSLTDVHLPLDLEKLLSEDWRKINGEHKESRSQALGRAVTDLAEAILTPSRIRNGRNLVIYPRSLMSESRIEVLGQDKLPK